MDQSSIQSGGGAVAGAAGAYDLGPALLDKITSDLMMDDEWVVRDERTLTWWGDSTPATFSVGPARMVQGDPTVTMTTSFTVLEDVAADEALILDTVDEVNRLASTGALVWLQDQRRVDAFFTWHNYEAAAQLTHLISGFALLLYAEAVGRADYLADTLGGRRPIVPHPASGARNDFDEMLTFTESRVLPEGQKPNRWDGEDFAELADYLNENDIGISTGGPGGLSVKFLLAQDAAERDLRQRSHPASGGDFATDPLASSFTMPSSLSQVLCVKHPIYGAGALELLKFPIRSDNNAKALANRLNVAEYRGAPPPALGAWCADDGGSGVAHNTFVPNVYHQPAIAPNLVLWSASRSRWAYESLTSGSPTFTD